MEDLDEEQICKVCRTEGTPDHPLFYPCKCRGSIKYVHQDCLEQWIRHSKTTKCELCKHSYRFTPIYADSTPNFVGFMPFITAALRKVVSFVPKFLRFSIVGLTWLIILPLITSMVWEMSFGSTADILVDVAINGGNISMHNSTLEASARNNSTKVNEHVPIWDIFSALTHGTLFKGFVASTGQVVTAPLLAKSFVSHSFFGAFTMASIFVMFLGLLSLFEYIKSLYRNEAIMRRLADIQARMAQNNGGEANNANVNQAEDNLEQELIEEAAAAEEQDGNQEEAMGFDELLGMSGSMFQFAGIVICVVLFIAAVIGAFVFIPNLIGRVALLNPELKQGLKSTTNEVIQYLVQPKSSINATAIEHDNQITLDHLEKFSQSLTARVLIGYIALLLMGFLWLCFIWTINAIFGLSIGKDAMHNVGRFVRRRRRNVAQNNANNNNVEQNNQQVVEQPQVAQNNEGENNDNVNDGQQVPAQEQPAANVNVNNNGQANNNQQEDGLEVEISFTGVLESTVVLVQFIFVILKVVLLIFVNILAHPAFLGFLLLNAVTMFNQPETITFENHSHDVLPADTVVVIDHDEAVEYSQATSTNITAEAIVEVVVSNITQAVSNATSIKTDFTSPSGHSTQFPHYLTLILYWVIGFIYLHLFWSVVQTIRRVGRPGILWFLRDPDDPNDHFIRDLVTKPMYNLVRAIFISVTLHSVLIFVNLTLPLHVIQLIQDRGLIAYKILPFNFRFYEAFTEVTSFALLINYFVPLLFKYVKPKDAVMYLIREWFMFIGELLEITPFLLPTHVNQVVPNNNNNNNENVNNNNNNNGPQLQNVAEAPKPSLFALRMILFGLATVAYLVLINLILICMPLIFGRLMIIFATRGLNYLLDRPNAPTIESMAAINDLYAYFFGVVFVSAISSGIVLLVSLYNRMHNHLRDNQHLRQFAFEINGTIFVKGMFVVWRLVAWLGTLVAVFFVIPLLFGIVIDFALLMPFRVTNYQTAIFYPLGNYVTGLIVFKTWHSLMKLELEIRWFAVWTQLQADNYLNLTHWWILLILPLTKSLAILLFVPYFFARGVIPLFGFSTVIEATVFRFSFISFASVIVLYALTRMAVVFLRRLHQKIIDDRYLRGMRLHNYENAANNHNVNNH